MKPAYTGIHGTYPEKQQEIMLPVKILKKLGINNPKRGMKIALDVSISFFHTHGTSELSHSLKHTGQI